MGLKKKLKKLKKENLQLWIRAERAATLLAEASHEIANLRRQIPAPKGKHTERDLTVVIDDPKDPIPHTFGLDTGFKAHPDNPNCFIKQDDPHDANHKKKKDWDSSLIATMSIPGSGGKLHTMEIYCPSGVQIHRFQKAYDGPVHPSGLTMMDNK